MNPDPPPNYPWWSSGIGDYHGQGLRYYNKELVNRSLTVNAWIAPWVELRRKAKSCLIYSKVPQLINTFKTKHQARRDPLD